MSKEETIQSIKNKLDIDIEDNQIQESSLKAVNHLLEIAEKHNFSTEGLFTELTTEINSAYVNNVCDTHAELKDLDIEKMAIAGKHRAKLNNSNGELNPDLVDAPVKIADAETKVKRHATNN